MRLFDADFFAALCTPVFLEGGVDLDVELAGGIVGNIKQGRCGPTGVRGLFPARGKRDQRGSEQGREEDDFHRTVRLLE